MKKYTVLLILFTLLWQFGALEAQTFTYSLVQTGDDVCVQVTSDTDASSSCYAGGDAVLIFPAGSTATIGAVTSSGGLGAWTAGMTFMNIMGIDFIQYSSGGILTATSDFVAGVPQTLFCVDAGTCDSADKIRLMDQMDASNGSGAGVDQFLFDNGVSHSITHGADCGTTSGAVYAGNSGCTTLNPICPPAVTTVMCDNMNTEATVNVTVSDGCGAYAISGDFSGNVADGVATDISTGIMEPGTYNYTITDVNGCVVEESSIAINQDCAPVELSTFTALPKGNAIALDWVAATEIAFDGYELQRSLDGLNFDKIAWIQGSENSLEEKQYNYLDLNVKGGITYYYRLKMIDLDESFEYSPIRSAQLNGKGDALEVFPNPTREAVSLTIDVPNDDRVNIRFFDATGKVALERVQDINEGNNALQFDVTSLPTGLYRIVVAGSQMRATQSVVIMD